MTDGVPIERQYIVVWDDGSVVVDWGDGTLQDVLTGEFRRDSGGQSSSPVLDRDLDRLKAAGRVETYDRRTVYLFSLPEGNRRTLD